MKKILVTIIAEDDKFETSSFMNDFISFKRSESAKEYHIKNIYYEEKRFFELTEDERVILRNIQQEWKTIFRGNLGTLELHNEKGGWTAFYPMSHLFQFIKNGEEYEIEELLK